MRKKTISYSEAVGGKKINWPERLDVTITPRTRKLYLHIFLKYAVDAQSWTLCPVSQLSNDIARFHNGAPVNIKLCHAGDSFNTAVRTVYRALMDKSYPLLAINAQIVRARAIALEIKHQTYEKP